VVHVLLFRKSFWSDIDRRRMDRERRRLLVRAARRLSSSPGPIVQRFCISSKHEQFHRRRLLQQLRLPACEVGQQSTESHGSGSDSAIGAAASAAAGDVVVIDGEGPGVGAASSSRRCAATASTSSNRSSNSDGKRAVCFSEFNSAAASKARPSSCRYLRRSRYYVDRGDAITTNCRDGDVLQQPATRGEASSSLRVQQQSQQRRCYCECSQQAVLHSAEPGVPASSIGGTGFGRGTRETFGHDHLVLRRVFLWSKCFHRTTGCRFC
jgi:hypothetical protein